MTAAVSTAQARDAAGLADAAGRAARLDLETVRLLMGSVVQALVEQAHPDGVDSGDVEALLRRCLHTAATWWPDLHPDVLLRVLAASLGVHPDTENLEADAAPAPPTAPTPYETICAAALLAAQLLPPGGDARRHVRSALAELERAQTVELP